MTRPAKPRERGARVPVPSPIDRWHEAAAIRDEWLTEALSTRPADRSAAEAAIGGLYALVGREPPDFVWVDSPAAALNALPPDPPPRLNADFLRTDPGGWPVALLLANLVSDLRAGLDARRRRARRSRWYRPPEGSTAEELLADGEDLPSVLRWMFHEPLRASVLDSLRNHIRAVLGNERGDLPWSGQHDAHWVAGFDVHRRLGMARYRGPDEAQLDLWAALARSCGWWWPYDEVCVVTERPAEIHAEPGPGRPDGEIRLHNPDGPALRYRDDWALYFWNGTRVPAWVVTDPDPARVAAEPNIEVRRCAIEKIGWEAYIERGGLRLLATAPDPGNPGCELRLYEQPGTGPASFTNILLAVNGSVERDGRRRRYGLNVPTFLDDPVAAAAWSYGLDAAQYATLVRRT
ncbi:DUF6745 domain-containing protein [Actinomadura kijaniata]|uniref:DUF6745 domain-containing protein n=1 Tax=Actinomadura kijaniata TaxID=46161 RepID=UPI00082B9281|nr:hypothetical protein [Actinomadura kijaniata]